MIFVQIPVGRQKNFAYLVADDESGDGIAVDPAWDIEKVLGVAESSGITILYVVNTHDHTDHVRGNEKISRLTGAKIAAHRAANVHRDLELRDGDCLKIGKVVIHVIHTPGHSPDSICLLVDGKLLTGDTLFVGECGSTGVFRGDAYALYESLFTKLGTLGDEVEVYPGHDYGEKPFSTLGHERRFNYTLRPRTKKEFAKFMAEP